MNQALNHFDYTSIYDAFTTIEVESAGLNQVNGTYRRWTDESFNGTVGFPLAVKYVKSTLLQLDSVNGGRESVVHFVISMSLNFWHLGRFVQQNSVRAYRFQLLYIADRNRQMQYPPVDGWRPTDNGLGILPPPRTIEVVDLYPQEAFIAAAVARSRLRRDVRHRLNQLSRVRFLQFSTHLQQIETDNVDRTCVVCQKDVRDESNVAVVECNCDGVGGRFFHSRCLENCFMRGLTSCPLCRLSLEE